MNDPIAGTLIVHTYDPHAGKLDVELQNVVLAAVSGNATCTVDGTLKTKRLSH